MHSAGASLSEPPPPLKKDMNFPQFSGDLFLVLTLKQQCNNFISVGPFTFYPVMSPSYSHEPPRGGEFGGGLRRFCSLAITTASFS